MLVSQQSDSAIHIHVSIPFQILFPFRPLQNIEQGPLCYTVGPCWLVFVLVFLKINLFIYFWLRWVFVVMCRLLIAVASLVAEHGLSAHGLQ